METIPEEHHATVMAFLSGYFHGSPASFTVADTAERKAIRDIVALVEERMSAMKYVLGLAMDFSLLAQQLSSLDQDGQVARPGLERAQLFDRYRLITARGSNTANTLTVVYAERKFGIRKLEESVIQLFLDLKRPSYPSSAPYVTGNWRKFEDSLLVPCFRLSQAGRYQLCIELISLGLQRLSKGMAVEHSGHKIRAFDRVLAEFPRSHERENAGTSLQGMAYGFFYADRPHLSLVVDKSRTGSARQRRFGDIDGYVGATLELCVEVKDRAENLANVRKDLGEFVARLEQIGAPGIAVVASADADSRQYLEKRGIHVLTLSDMQEAIRLWDWRKQELALQGYLHFVSNIEQNPDAVMRLRSFIGSVDESHPAALKGTQQADA